MATKVETVTRKPRDCSEPEIKDFVSLVLAGGEVTAVGLEDRVRRAELLVFLQHDGCLKGIAAVKNPVTHYANEVFRKAQVPNRRSAYQFELGWVFVMPSSRGAGFSHQLVATALSSIAGQGIFATSNADNVAMHRALGAHGFLHIGVTFASNRGNHQLVLFVDNVAQPGAPEDAAQAGRP